MPSLCETTVEKLKNHRLVVGLILLVLIVGAASTFIGDLKSLWFILHPPKPFDVQIDYIAQANGYWIVSDGGDISACRAPLLLDLITTNLQPNPATLSEYTVERLETWGHRSHWKKPDRIQVGSEQHLYESAEPVLDKKHAILTDIDPAPLDTRLAAVNSTLTPYIPVRGMTFFDFPAEYEVTIFRVNVKDTLGHHFTSAQAAADIWSE